jgi:hypothetical protein
MLPGPTPPDTVCSASAVEDFFRKNKKMEKNLFFLVFAFQFWKERFGLSFDSFS